LTVTLAGLLSFATATYVARREVRRRERISFLLEAYRSLADAADRELETNPRPLEQALSDIGLLGGHEQIEAARAFAISMAADGHGKLDDVLAVLRTELRRELGLRVDVPNVPVLRIHGRDGRSRESDTIAPGNDPNPPRDGR
jgi:hypothetical protein